MVNHLVSVVAYVTPDEKASIERQAVGTVSNYVRSKLGLSPLRRGRGKGQTAEPKPAESSKQPAKGEMCCNSCGRVVERREKLGKRCFQGGCKGMIVEV